MTNESKSKTSAQRATAGRRLPTVPMIVLPTVVGQDPAQVRDSVEHWIARNPNVLAGVS